MKRSALTRRTPFARGEGPKRRTPLLAVTPAKPRGGFRPASGPSIPVGSCICGCGRQRGVQLHHVTYQQEIRRVLLAEHRASGVVGPPDIVRELAVLRDPRNLVPVGPKCHAAHHNRSRPLSLHMLPDSALEFASDLLGPGRAYEYLRRRYAGSDVRLVRLLDATERRAA